jgi:putative membrane protein
MKTLLKFILTALAAIIASYILPGVYVADFFTAIILALVLGLLNVTIRPILIVLTIPATLFTFGLFILVINAVVILVADAIIPGFAVDNFGYALLFSVLLWLTNSLLKEITGEKDDNRRNG